ncbi:MAG: nucleotidyl transferase AbiEii/AbiGii toxin family protein [Chlamydiae bacterium]|nr:nucleotidyl transferase AbiEii/AbiGii toxin family protein [Chlamydiota bacterium]MBI3265934.1 nucleotidyl transferase AbiEii/AbiGii toxin family protein [Chlamydiota bacterium]
MAYYHDLVTQQSWEELQTLSKKLDFILIGGWAVYLYTKALKSKDIDIIINFDQLPNVAKHYQLIKNERLKKYEAVKGNVQIDIYLPHFSELGIPVHILYDKKREIEGYTLLDADYLLALKLYALSERARTSKGEKDFIDCLALLQSGVSHLGEATDLMKTYGLTKAVLTFRTLLNTYQEIPELGLNAHHLARLKKEIKCVNES